MLPADPIPTFAQYEKKNEGKEEKRSAVNTRGRGVTIRRPARTTLSLPSSSSSSSSSSPSRPLRGRGSARFRSSSSEILRRPEVPIERIPANTVEDCCQTSLETYDPSSAKTDYYILIEPSNQSGRGYKLVPAPTDEKDKVINIPDLEVDIVLDD